MEGSTALKRLLSSQEIDFQLVPPCLHSRNTAECAIRTFKNHFIVGLCCTWRFGRRPRAVSVAWAHLYAFQSRVFLSILHGLLGWCCSHGVVTRM
jgi:hypothetical protein